MSEAITRHGGGAGCFRSWAATHRGTVRGHNEDAFVNRPDLGLWAVADGAGGHHAGEVASAAVRDALDGIPAGLSAQAVLGEVRGRIEAAHRDLREQAARRGRGVTMATTVVVLLAHGDHFACLWAGDSRAYLLRAGALVPVSRDHSLVEELLESGAITPEQALNHPRGNVITRAVGADIEGFELEKRSGRLMPGDRLLLCSDGLCKCLDDDAIGAVLGAAEEDGAGGLVQAALAAGATDNVTAVTVRVGEAGTEGPG